MLYNQRFVPVHSDIFHVRRIIRHSLEFRFVILNISIQTTYSCPCLSHGDIALRILNLRVRLRWLWPSSLFWQRFVPSHNRLDGAHNRENTSILPLPEIERLFIDRPARSLITVPTELCGYVCNCVYEFVLIVLPIEYCTSKQATCSFHVVRWFSTYTAETLPFCYLTSQEMSAERTLLVL